MSDDLVPRLDDLLVDIAHPRLLELRPLAGKDAKVGINKRPSIADNCRGVEVIVERMVIALHVLDHHLTCLQAGEEIRPSESGLVEGSLTILASHFLLSTHRISLHLDCTYEKTGHGPV